MQPRQAKTNSPSPDTQPAEPIQKASQSAVASTRTPAWIQAMGDHPPAHLQAKLTLNQPGDAYEQEADLVADPVMRKSAHGSPIPPAVLDEEEEERLRLMRKEHSDGGNVQHVPSIVGSVINSGSGQPLDAPTQARMESHFGHDFSNVRVHTDEQA